MFNKNPASRFEKVVIRKNKPSEDCFTEDLEDLIDKSAENIKKVLESRLAVKEHFTLAGSNLIHLEGGSGKTNLLMKVVEKVYDKLKLTHKTQIFAINGSSIRSKEFCKRNVLGQLGYLSSSLQGFVQVIHSAYELLSIFGSDGGNLYYGECIELWIDTEFKICGSSIKAKLIDLDMNESCGIFRILLSLADPSLQHLGLMHRVLNEKNIELHQQFKSNLDLLGITWTETLDIMELLAVALLTEDLTLSTSSYTVAGQKALNKFSPVNSKHFMKICKILSIVPARVSEFFTTFSKQQGADRLKSFKKLMIFLAFEGFLEKINSGLNRKSQEFGLGKGNYSIKILSCPLAKSKKGIDGFVSNLIVECFEFLSYEQYLSVLSTFNEEKIPAHKLTVPRCRYIVELFLDRSFGILFNFGSQRFWNNLQRELSGDSVYNKIINIEKNALSINNSWGSSFYELNYLQHQFSMFPDSSFMDILKKCSNRLIQSNLDNFFNFSYHSYTNYILSELLLPCSASPTSILFCYKDPNDLIFESSLPSILNIPYRYLIKKKLLSPELLKKNGCFPQSSENFYYFDKGQKDCLKRVLTGKIPVFEVSGVIVANDNFLTGPKLDEYIDIVIKPKRTVTRSSSAKLRVFSVCSSKTSTKQLHTSIQNFKNYSFVDFIPEIIRIQSVWRGFRAKRYYDTLLKLHNSARLIQKVWKGYKQRKKINIKKIFNAIRVVQRLYKRWFFRKNRAAKVIQKFFLQKFYTFSQNSRTGSSVPGKSSIIFLKTTQRSLIRAQKTEKIEKKFKFVPSLSKKTLELAKNIQKTCYKGLKIEDRLILQGKEMNEKKDVAALNKKRGEIRLNPSSSAKNFNNHFYEDNLQFLVDKKTSLKDLKIAKIQKEMTHCTFKPNIKSDKRPRSALETVSDLNTWNQKRKRQIESVRKANEQEESQKMRTYRVTGKSEQINKVKQKEDLEKTNLVKRLQKSIEPYWPNK